jgi:hypothetical protein
LKINSDVHGIASYAHPTGCVQTERKPQKQALTAQRKALQILGFPQYPFGTA